MTYTPPLIFGPIAPENNPPINPEYYLPSVFDISGIQLGPITVITTSVNHNYAIGQQIRLLIPLTYGSFQLNGLDGLVTAIPAANQVTTTINSTMANAFKIGSTTTPAQIIAIGDVNTGTTNTQGRVNNGTFIPGSFIDISPAFDS
jgi:hypothetical protein